MLYTNICFIRYLWFLEVLGKYILLVQYYFQAKTLPIDHTYAEYVEMWPAGVVVKKFFTWNLRAFAVNQDKFDEVIKFAMEEKQKLLAK